LLPKHLKRSRYLLKTNIVSRKRFKRAIKRNQIKTNSNKCSKRPIIKEQVAERAEYIGVSSWFGSKVHRFIIKTWRATNYNFEIRGNDLEVK